MTSFGMLMDSPGSEFQRIIPPKRHSATDLQWAGWKSLP